MLVALKACVIAINDSSFKYLYIWPLVYCLQPLFELHTRWTIANATSGAKIARFNVRRDHIIRSSSRIKSLYEFMQFVVQFYSLRLLAYGITTLT